MPNKIIRDPIFNYVTIDSSSHAYLLHLLDTPEIQRLRHIHQLGVSFLTYPGADHSRLCHSLGVLHLMQLVTEHLKREGHLDDELAEKALLAAALIHDVGHGPFSHLLEPVLGGDHEEWTRRVIADPDTGVNRVLDAEDGLRDAVGALLGERRGGALWHKSLLSSQLDVDRMDYLRRNSYFLGVGYGDFDWFRLINTMQLLEHRRTGQLYLAWPEKAKYSIEEYIFARFYMYQNVYLHHCTRGFEGLLRRTWERAKELLREGDPVEMLPAVRSVIGTEQPGVRQYLRLAEYHILAQMEAWQDARDPVLADLSRRFLSRNGFGAVELPAELAGIEAFDRVRSAYGYLTNAGYSPSEYYLWEDRGESKVYDAYHPERESELDDPNTAIFLHVPGGQGTGLIEISDALPDRLKPLTDRRLRRHRYYCPKEHREQIARILEGR